MLKPIGRHPRLDTKEEQARLILVLAKKVVTPNPAPFQRSADEGLVLALLCLVGRWDLERAGFDLFLEALP